MSSSTTSTTTSTTVVHSASGATANVNNYGATVTSYVTKDGRECLFVSRDAILDGSKAVRGGVPLVFPHFGPAPPANQGMPQHGFLRNNVWQIDESSTYDNDESAGISLTLKLKDVESSRGDAGESAWSKDSTKFDCTCVYKIQVFPTKLTTTLEIKNTGTTEFPFQTLLHTYYMVEEHQAMDGTQCYVKGLEGYSVDDKITGEKYTQKATAVTIDNVNVDRVYTPPAGGANDVVNVTIGVGASKMMRLSATGLAEGTSVPVSCVVWNPYKEKAAQMGDFGDDQVNILMRLSVPTLDEMMAATHEFGDM